MIVAFRNNIFLIGHTNDLHNYAQTIVAVTDGHVLDHAVQSYRMGGGLYDCAQLAQPIRAPL